MRKLIVLCLLTIPSVALSQELPKVTEEGKKAALKLLSDFVEGGGLKLERIARTNKGVTVVGDLKKLRELVKQRRTDFTPAVRDALLGGCEQPGVVAVLLAAGEETKDEQATAFGRFFAARIAAQQLRYDAARQDYERAGKSFEALKLPGWQATSVGNMATVCQAQGDLPRARILCQQAFGLFKQLYGEQHASVATAMNNLAMVCRVQGDLLQAQTLCQQALNLRRRIHGERHPDVAAALGNLAVVCLAQGDLPQARKLHQQALGLFKQIHSEPHPDVATTLSNLALVFLAQGELPQARMLHQQALELFKQVYGERHPSVATSLNNLAMVYRAQGDLPHARKLFQQGLEVFKQIHGGKHARVAFSLSNLALVCQEQGELAQARQLQQQALDLFKQLHGDRHADVATFLNNLAQVCRAQGDLPHARKLFQEALDLCKKIHGERHPGVAASLSNLAGVYKDQEELTQSRKLYQQASDLMRGIHGERHPDVAACLNNLAGVCLDQEDLLTALRIRTDAVLASRLPGVEHKNLADLHPRHLTCDANTVHHLHYLGLILQLSGKGKDAAIARQAGTAYALAAELLDRLRSDGLESEEGKLFQAAKHAALVPARVALSASLFRLESNREELYAAFHAVEQGRGRVFLQAFSQARARQIGGVPTPLQNKERDLLSYLRGLDASLRKENSKTLDKRNADLVQQLYEVRHEKEEELKRLVDRMRQEHPQYAALQYPKPCSLQQARDCLHPNEVAVLFALDKMQSFAVIVKKSPTPGDKGEGVAVVPLPGAALLAGKVRTLTDRELLGSDSRTRRLAAELHELLLKPLAPHIEGKDLLLVPDGVLWELPFELLVEGRTATDDGKYLIESRQIRYSPSLTVLHLIGLWEKTRKLPTEPLWALADPVFSKDDPRAKGDLHRETRNLLELYAQRSRGGESYAALPGTRREVEAIARLHGTADADLALGRLASEKVLKGASVTSVLSRKRYVHLATHGILGSERGRPPSLVLSLVGNEGEETDGGGVNDGFLSFVEVTHLKLNADLVVLSACETGRGDLRPGEGVVGLSRSFLYAGSRGVVCSLWQVDDEQTSRLMQELYAELKKGTPSREALTKARRSLIAEEQAPLYWAPFILIGK